MSTNVRPGQIKNTELFQKIWGGVNHYFHKEFGPREYTWKRYLGKEHFPIFFVCCMALTYWATWTFHSLKNDPDWRIIKSKQGDYTSEGDDEARRLGLKYEDNFIMRYFAKRRIGPDGIGKARIPLATPFAHDYYQSIDPTTMTKARNPGDDLREYLEKGVVGGAAAEEEEEQEQEE